MVRFKYYMTTWVPSSGRQRLSPKLALWSQEQSQHLPGAGNPKVTACGFSGDGSTKCSQAGDCPFPLHPNADGHWDLGGTSHIWPLGAPAPADETFHPLPIWGFAQEPSPQLSSSRHLPPQLASHCKDRISLQAGSRQKAAGRFAGLSDGSEPDSGSMRHRGRTRVSPPALVCSRTLSLRPWNHLPATSCLLPIQSLLSSQKVLSSRQTFLSFLEVNLVAPQTQKEDINLFEITQHARYFQNAIGCLCLDFWFLPRDTELRGLCNFAADYPFQRIHIHKRIVIFQIETLVPAANAVWGGFPCHNKASCGPQSGVDTAFPPRQSRVQLSLPFPAPARCPITQREINFICATILWLDS